MQCQGDKPGVLQLSLDLREFGDRGRHDHASVVVRSGSQRPQDGEAGGGLGLFPTRSQVSGDIDRKISLLAVPLVGLADLVGGLIVSHSPRTPVTGPDRRNPESFALGVGAEPGGTIARGAQLLNHLEELLQGHSLAEGEALGEHPLSRFDLSGENGVRLGPGEIEGRIAPGRCQRPGDLILEQRQRLCLQPLSDGE